MPPSEELEGSEEGRGKRGGERVVTGWCRRKKEEEGGRKRERGKGRKKISFSTIEGQAWCSGFDKGDREVGGSLFVVVRSFFFFLFCIYLDLEESALSPSLIFCPLIDIASPVVSESFGSRRDRFWLRTSEDVAAYEKRSLLRRLRSAMVVCARWWWCSTERLVWWLEWFLNVWLWSKKQLLRLHSFF